MPQDDRNRAVPPDEGIEPACIEPSTDSTARFVILGETSRGKIFRPSDWAERLAGVMAAFRPGKAGSQHHLSYSPYVVPSSQRGVKCVIVDPHLRDLEPMAYSFVVNFARDNDLVTEPLETPTVTTDPAASQS